MNEPHEGKRKVESLWPIHQINWQRSRYVYDMFYVHKKISREVYDFCIKNKIVDANLIAKWKKPGYERLCSTYVINAKNFNHGTVSICRVPRQYLSADQHVECQHAGCRGCASGAGGHTNIFGNKYGQYLAAIQVAREKRLEAEEAAGEDELAKQAWQGEDEQLDVDLEYTKKKKDGGDEADAEAQRTAASSHSAGGSSGEGAAKKRRTDGGEEEEGS